MPSTEANSINAATAGIVGNTGTAFTGTAVTQYNVLTGAATSSTINNVAPSATSGVPLISQGSSSQPVFGTAVVAGGGTGDTSFTAYALIAGGTTTTGALQSIASVGTSGQVLTSNGASALPTFQAAAASGIVTINGDTGSVTGTTVTIYANNATQQAGKTVLFSNSGTTSTLNVTDANDNTLVGLDAGAGSNVGTNNTGFGFQALQIINGGQNNTFVGAGAGNHVGTGSDNTGIGLNVLDGLTSGGWNIAIGESSGNTLTTEGNNILINNVGTVAESNAIHIGTQGSGSAQQNKCFIAGIVGVTASNAVAVTINSSTGQLGVLSGAPFTSITRQVFTSTGTYTPTSGMLYCDIECVGGGGGGGAVTSTSSTQTVVAGSGGGGEYSRGIFSATTIGASKSVTIGAAGAAGTSSGGGGTGGTTSVGSTLISSVGGSGGGAGAGPQIGANENIGGAGGTGGTGGDFRVQGSPGGAAFSANIAGGFAACMGGAGGSTFFGGGALAVTSINSAATAGNAATAYGGGGGGAISGLSGSGANGGAGAKGVVIITEYI